EFKNCDKLKKCKSRKNKIFEQKEEHFLYDCNQKQQKKVAKSAEQVKHVTMNEGNKKVAMQETSNSINTEQRVKTSNSINT
ncbi:45704_t:CDS:1, partial [Gigaspora margarita]